jgi:hypothetical protein
MERAVIKESKVGMLVEDWLDRIGAKKLSYWDAKESGCAISVYPDFLIKPKFFRKRLVAIEVKGSKFSKNTLIGQLLLYSLHFPFVYVAIPSECEETVRKLRSKIRRRIKGFDFGIISVAMDGKIEVFYPEKWNGKS